MNQTNNYPAPDADRLPIGPVTVPNRQPVPVRQQHLGAVAGPGGSRRSRVQGRRAGTPTYGAYGRADWPAIPGAAIGRGVVGVAYQGLLLEGDGSSRQDSQFRYHCLRYICGVRGLGEYIGKLRMV